MEVGKLAHSHSQPGGMDRTPPGTPKKGGKMLAVRVQMLDDTVTMFQVQAKALGRVLFDQVCNQLNLLESDYFGLEYQEAGGTKYWLDLEKPLCRQIGLSMVDTLVRFCVKFYTPDPSQLEEEFTRYLFCLQIKRDLSQGLLQCNSNTAALMASYIVQAECGDYVVEDYPDHRYLSSYKFVPNQDQELERRIMENHKKHAGQSPAEADLNLLETARRCELYGIKMHPAKDHEGCPLNLAVAHMGIVVFQNFSKINTFSWAKIRKISFKRKRFLVKLHPEGYGYYKDTVEFFFEGRNECKNFWKKCVENHGFFRCTMVKKVPRQKTRVLSRGSSFRYSGRTQKQIVDFVRENYMKRQTFQRSQSFRHSSSAHSSVANVGTSISAHPLLPLGDNAVAGTPASLSCGSMTLTSSPIHTADIHAGASPSPPLTTSVSPGTSVTSSPQHFYPQETPYRRAGHRPTRVKHPPVRSHRAISPLLSPTDVATAASNRSANHSNNGTAVDRSDLINSRNSLKSPEFIDFNDVYSNCYTSLRSLGNPVENKIVDEENKIDVFNVPCNFLGETSKSNESIKSLSSKSKTPFSENDVDVDVDRYTWHRSASCKDLYHEAGTVTENEKSNDLLTALETPYDAGEAPSLKRYEKSMRKCYSAAVSKNPSIDRSNDVGNDMRIYSSSYPGTSSSLSTESAEREPEDPMPGILDVKYDSQEEIALSHDDISHDSYELLERELYEYNDESLRNKRNRIVGDSERTRSCSWGSDRGVISPLDFRSFENILGSGVSISGREQNLRILERENNVKHKSEIDFRSFSDQISNTSQSAAHKFDRKTCDDVERKERTPDFFDHDSRFGKRSREVGEEIFEIEDGPNQPEKRIYNSKGLRDVELNKDVCQEMKARRASREENLNVLDRKKNQNRRKSFEELADPSISLEFGKKEPLGRTEDTRRRMEKRREKREREERFHEGLKEKEEKEWEKEKERRQMDRRKSVEEKELRKEETSAARKITPKTKDYVNFQEIHFKKFERVVSNQFGKYPEFLTLERNPYDFHFQEKKVMENYEKMCQVSKLAKEIKKNEKNCASTEVHLDERKENIRKMNKHITNNNFGQSMEFKEWENAVIDLTTGSKVGRAHVERTKSDPYNSLKIQKRNILLHQKSIDLTPQHSEETTSDYDNEDSLKKTSRSEHDIPYILHKRHCMNGTARNSEVTFFKSSFISKAPEPGHHEKKGGQLVTESKKSIGPDVHKQKPSCAKVAEAKKAGVQIINLDAKSDKIPVRICESKKGGKPLKPAAGKKSLASDAKPMNSRGEKKIVDRQLDQVSAASKLKSETTCGEDNKINRHEASTRSEESEEPIYAEVCTERDEENSPSSQNVPSVPPEPPARSSSVLWSPCSEERKSQAEKKGTDKSGMVKRHSFSERREKSTKASACESANTSKTLRVSETKPSESEAGSEFRTGKDWKAGEGGIKSNSGSSRGKQEVTLSTSVHQRREDSLTLFARTRLGLSEGSAFAPMVRQGRVGSPSSQRRAKSLDAPYVSVHSLPPADAFSSKDDTVEGNDSDIVNSALAKFAELCKGDSKKLRINTGERKPVSDPPENTESEVDSVFTDDLENEINFKKAVERQSKVEISCPEEKVLDGVRGKRLLSKIESVDFIDSEGDLDSSKVAERPPIPSDRLVNLPESIRFPSVRQISGQTSEESADGWDQKEVKVKRRTPRRSVGREEQDTRTKESVVWDSKDEEPQDDDVWDDSLAPTGNSSLPSEYLKRGSCGQSIDDDNLSTPMKESSPEHWVSVDDLPEALEREEKLLKQQEKILREKILNEKLKRELNLDTIDVDERYCDYRERAKQSKFEEESASLKESIKGHSLDTYELNEKKLRERGNNKNSSLDVELLPNKLIDSFGGVEDKEKLLLKPSAYQEGLDYIQCKVVKDVSEIDQFGDNDEELEEFFVVLDENLGKEGRNVVWDDDDTYRRTLLIDETLISVPEEFKDAEREDDSLRAKAGENGVASADEVGRVKIRLNEVQSKRGRILEEGSTSVDLILQEKLTSVAGLSREDFSMGERKSSTLENVSSGDFKSVAAASADVGRLSPFGGSRRGSEENRKLSLSEDAGRLSPYDSSRRSSDDPRRFSTSEDVDRLSPFSDSRREVEDPRRLSTSEDSRKCSASESVSEETRRRLSSTEETRRKRASLTKQCSVGAESLSDEVISGIQECSSSFEHDEKDVFESDSPSVKPDEVVVLFTCEMKNRGGLLPKRNKEQIVQGVETPPVKHSVADASEEALNLKRCAEVPPDFNGTVHLAPPTSERELSRETEDSVDYGEGDFKDIRDVVKEKDISEGLIGDAEPIRSGAKKSPNSFEKSESSEGDELRYIDDKRGSTPEILVGKSREAIAMSIVVVNEGISVLNKIKEKYRVSDSEEVAKSQSLPRKPLDTTKDKSDFGERQRHTLPKTLSKSKPVDYVHKKLTKIVPEIKVKTVLSPGEENVNKESVSLLKSSLDSSQESDLDRLSDLSLVSHVQNQIAKKNLSDAGKCLRKDEFGGITGAGFDGRKTCLEEENHKIFAREGGKNESSSSELKSSAEELFYGEESRWNDSKVDKTAISKTNFETRKAKKEGNLTVTKEKRSPEQEKRESGEDGSSSSSAPPCPKRELSSTWKPFLLESSGSSSLEEGWLPPDENAHLADEEETSSTSNNQQDDSCHDDLDYPTGIGYPVVNGEMMVGGYGSVFALSRTLSRISERSTSEQERSDAEDDITKPSSRSASVEEESILSSDHQPSLSSDPPSPKESASAIPDLPVDKHAITQPFETSADATTICEPFEYGIPPPLPEADWPSPPSSFGAVDPPVLGHVETFYMEIHPEKACKVVVAGTREEENSSSDENQTLQEESEFLHLSSDNMSASTTTTTTQDGTVVIPVRPSIGKAGSLSEDASMISTSEWSSPTFGKPRPNFEEDGPEQMKNAGLLDRQASQRGVDLCESQSSAWSSSPSKYCPEGFYEQDPQKPKISSKIKPLKLSSPTAKTFGFFETPVSKVRSPTSQIKFFELTERRGSGNSSLRSPTSFSETTSPKNYGRFFEGHGGQISMKGEACERRTCRSPTKGKFGSRGACTPYYSNVADSAERSYFGRYDTGSLERTKIQSSRKCCSYYSVSKNAPNEGDSSNSDGPLAPSPNTIPRASRKTKKRHRVAMDLVVRDGKIVAPPKTKATIVETSDSDRSSPRGYWYTDSRRKQSDV